MQQSIVEFVDRVTTAEPALAEARDATMAYWAPDAPPVTTLLGELGEAFAARFDAADPDARRAVLAEIEAAVSSGDAALRTAVATGMIEGMIGGGHGSGSWARVRRHLGRHSAAHADGWAG